MNKSEQINELATALAKAQAQIKGALKDSNNPFFKSDYADLASCWEACRGPLTSHGLSVIQTFDSRVITEGTIHTALVTTLMHSSGQWIDSTVPIMPIKNDPQTFTATVTYLRRSSLSSIVGLAQIDDDGETAVGRKDHGSHTTAPQQSKPSAPLAYNPKTLVPIGKDKGSPIDKWSIEELRAMVTWMQEKAAKDNKPMSKSWSDFCDQVKFHEQVVSKNKISTKPDLYPVEDLKF